MPPLINVMATRGSIQSAQAICAALDNKLPQSLRPDNGFFAQPEVTVFSNHNLQVQVPNNVRDRTVVIIHTQTPSLRVNEEIWELFLLIQALRDSKAGKIIIFFPYMPGSRSDRKNQPRISTGSTLLAQLINALEIREIIIVECHDDHVKHYFQPAADTAPGIFLLADYLQRVFFREHSPENCFILFPDTSAKKRFEPVLDILPSLPFAYLDKRRVDNSEKPEIVDVVGGLRQTAIMLDDEVGTGGSSLKAVQFLHRKTNGTVKKYVLMAVHGSLQDSKLTTIPFFERLIGLEGPFSQLVVTDTIPVTAKLEELRRDPNYPNLQGKLIILPSAGLSAEIIARAVQGNSLTELHQAGKVSLYRQDPIIL